MTLAPIPATETLRVLLEKSVEEDGVWQVFDLNGRLVLSGQMPAEILEQSIPISILSEGTYVLRLLAGQEVMVEPFIKENQ